jgi:cytochrome P450
MVGSVAWLRASVSRFANGDEHGRRRSLAIDELARLDYAALRSAAYRRTITALAGEGHPGGRGEVMGSLARRVPMAALAESMGVADPERAAGEVIRVAAAYFPGAGAAAQESADSATAELVAMLRPADLEVIVARIALLVQGCDATAGLIGNALHILGDGRGAGASWSTEALLAETLRHTPPLRASRRVASTPIDFGGHQILAGETVVCSVDAANRDPAVFDQPQRFDPGRRDGPSLTFGYGVRPCPGAAQALALAAGVVDALREQCTFVPPGTPVEYEPSAFLRIPRHVEAQVAAPSGQVAAGPVSSDSQRRR